MLIQYEKYMFLVDLEDKDITTHINVFNYAGVKITFVFREKCTHQEVDRPKHHKIFEEDFNLSNTLGKNVPVISSGAFFLDQ